MTRSASSWLRPRPARRTSQVPQLSAASRQSRRSSRLRAGGGQLGLERADQLLAEEGLSVAQAGGDLGGERTVHVGGAPDRRDGLQQQRPLVHEAIEARRRAAARAPPGRSEHGDPLDEPLRHRRVQRLEVVEVLEHAAHRHLGPLGHPRGGGAQVALLEQADGGVDDRLAGAHRPQGAAVGGESFLHGACRIVAGEASGLGRHRRAVVGHEPPAGLRPRTNRFTAATVPPPSALMRFSSTVTQAASPITDTASSVRMNWSGLGPPNSANHDPDTAPQPWSVRQPGWVHVTRSVCSHTSDMASRSRASNAS